MRKLFLVSLAIGVMAGTHSVASENAGKTIMSRGAVTAFDTSSDKQRTLHRRDPIFNVDRVITEEGGRAQFSMVDGGLLSVKPNSEVNISSYSYDPETKEGSAVIELVKGGLRSISGQIKKYGGDYQVKTPVGSIGIRGTHFELEMVAGEMFVAVWDGAIDLSIGQGADQSIVSFGAGEAYSFGVVSSDGQVTQLLNAPANFKQGHSTNASQSSSDDTATENDSEDDTEITVIEQVELGEVEVVSTTEDNSIYNENLLAPTDGSLADSLASRTGQFTYGNVLQSAVTSNAGTASDFGVSMVVDFDNGVVSNGELTATDSGGDWYAAFSGLIDVTALDLAVTFASHGNERAEGSIDGAFLGDGNSITGNFELNEIVNPNNKLTGTFIID